MYVNSEQILKKYKRKYPWAPYELRAMGIVSMKKYSGLHSYGDAPAMVGLEGVEEWFKEGERHREGNKPAIIHPKGEKLYFRNGKEYDPVNTPEKRKKQINKLTAKKSSKQKERENVLKEFVSEMLKI